MKFAEHNYLPLFRIGVKVQNGFRLHQERDWHKDKSSHIGLISLKTGKKIFPIMQLLLICNWGSYFNWSDFYRAKKKTGKIRFVNVFYSLCTGCSPFAVQHSYSAWHLLLLRTQTQSCAISQIYIPPNVIKILFLLYVETIVLVSSLTIQTANLSQ